MSRTAPYSLVSLAGLASAALGLLAPAPLAAQSYLAMEPDVLGPIARQQALAGGAAGRSRADCEPSDDPDEIVVCAPVQGPDFRVPYQPVPGAPPRRAMGELPRAAASIEECHRLCEQGVMLNLNVGRFLTDPGGALKDMRRGR